MSAPTLTMRVWTDTDGMELLCPVLLCADCGEPVTLEDHAVYDGADSDPEVRAVHKGECDRRYGMRRFGHYASSWRPLRTFLPQLLHNAEHSEPMRRMRRHNPKGDR